MHCNPNFAGKKVYATVLTAVISRRYAYGFTERHSSLEGHFSWKGYI